jgi:lactobin A/cerein 7B family class IIb bacteriocin
MKTLNQVEIEEVNGGFLPALAALIVIGDFAVGVYEGFTA